MAETKKVLIITNGGTGLYGLREELIEKLQEKQYGISLAYPDEAYRKEFAEMGCRCIRLEVDGTSLDPLKDVRYFFDCIKVLRREKPDIALLYTIKPCIYGGMACALCSVPSIATVTGVSRGLITENKIVSTIATVLSRIGYARSKQVFFQNQSNEQQFTRLKIAPGKHTLVSGSGVNLVKHPFEEYSESDGKIKLLYLGRFLRIKGLEELAVAMEAIQEEEPDVVCKIVGWSWDELPLLDKAVEKGIIQRCDPTNDVNGYLKWCDALVLPSNAEGMSNVMLEAAATGRPSLASNIPGCREIVEDGRTGILFEPGSSEAIYQAIMQFIHLPYEERKQMGFRAREKVEREFDRTEVIEQYIQAVDRYIA